jgi:hypothetical protein
LFVIVVVVLIKEGWCATDVVGYVGCRETYMREYACKRWLSDM